MLVVYFMDGESLELGFQIFCLKKLAGIMVYNGILTISWLIYSWSECVRRERARFDNHAKYTILNLTRIGANRDGLYTITCGGLIKVFESNETPELYIYVHIIASSIYTVHEISRGSFPITRKQMRTGCGLRRKSCDSGIVSGFLFLVISFSLSFRSVSFLSFIFCCCCCCLSSFVHSFFFSLSTT